jgi:hypothetical protein
MGFLGLQNIRASLYEGMIKIVARASTIGANSIIRTRMTAALGIDDPKSDNITCRETGKARDMKGTAAWI